MKPLLFASDATSFTGNGIGPLNDVIECVVHEQLNGVYELNMTMLASDTHFNDLQVGSIIVVQPNAIDDRQPFVVSEITKDITGEVQIYGVHIAIFEMQYMPVSPMNTTTLANALSAIKNNQATTNDITFSYDQNKNEIFKRYKPYYMLELVGGEDNSIIHVFGQELHYNLYDVHFGKRGNDTDYTIVYGRNMTSFTDKQMFTDTYDGVQVYYFTEENGLVMSNPYLYEGSTGQRYLLLDVSDSYETKPTQTQLNMRATLELVRIYVERQNIKLTIDMISDVGMDISEYSLLELGDSVLVRNTMYNIEYHSRIIETFWNVLLDRYDSVVIGDTVEDINQIVSGIAQTEISKIETKASNVKYYQGNVNASTVQGAIDKLGTDVSTAQTNINALQETASQYTARFNTQQNSPDLNTLTTNYLGYVTSSTNGPSGVNASGQLIVASRNTSTNTWCLQVYSPYNSDNIYTRTCNGGTWTNWVKITDANDIGKQIISYQRVNVASSSTVADKATATLTGTMSAVSGATEYLLIAERVNFGFFTGNPSRSGTTVTCNAMNSSGASHTLNGTVIAIALK